MASVSWFGFFVRLSLVHFLIWSFFSSSFYSWLSGLPSYASCLPWGSSTSLSSLGVCVFPSAFVFLYLTPFCCSLLLRGFSQITSYAVAVFSCYIHVRLQLCSSFTFFCCTFFPYSWRRETGKFPRLLPQFFSIDSSVPLRPWRLASSCVPSGPLWPW